MVACKAALIAGTQSISCQHAPPASEQNIPVWVITYWAEVLDLCTTSHKAWMQAEEFIQLQKKAWKKKDDGKNTDEAMQVAYDTPSCLLWSGNIHGFDHNVHAWLATTHENQNLDLLHHDILLHSSNIKIENMDFFPNLCKAYDRRDTDVYDKSHGFAEVCAIRKALVAGERDGLGTMVNIEGDHWVGTTMDASHPDEHPRIM
jgi:hypothetical protein